MFYTQIPVPEMKEYYPEDLNKATRFMPLIGWIVGLISASFYFIGDWLFGYSIGVLLAIMSGVITTGAFHEDGLADAFDGFGGGWTKTKILDIMKDSRIGTYGSVSLIFLFGLKYLSLHTLLTQITDKLSIILLFICYHSLARLTSIAITFTASYSREDATSKVKPIAIQHTWKEVSGAFVFGLIPLIALMFNNISYLLVILPLFLLGYFSRRYFIKWIDGYTGDCLGAVEQLGECLCLLTFIILWKFM